MVFVNGLKMNQKSYFELGKIETISTEGKNNEAKAKKIQIINGSCWLVHKYFDFRFVFVEKANNFQFFDNQ